MNKLFYSLILAAAAMPAMAAVNTVNYQVLVRNAEGKPVANSEIGMRFRVVGAEGALYEETASVKTDDAGIASYEIGSQNPEGFASIDWNGMRSTRFRQLLRIRPT